MGIFDSFRNKSSDNLVEVVDTTTKTTKLAEYNFPDIEVGSYVDNSAFAKFRELSNDRQAQYNAYDEMTKDIIISSALEMYADDASQYDHTGKMIWAESEDDSLAEYINELLDTLCISDNLWTIYYLLATYGDVYIRLFKKQVNKSNLTEQSLLDESVDYEDYIEICDEPKIS